MVGRRVNKVQQIMRLASMLLVVAAVVQELRKPSAERTWHGKVAGFVPYDFRKPTLDRVRQSLWQPDRESLISPQVFGVGWTLNVGRLVELIRRRFA
jgi:hypothetical protein